jgi:hypothetical protein
VCEVTWQLWACCIPIVLKVVVPLRPLVQGEGAEAVKVSTDRHEEAVNFRKLSGVAAVRFWAA